jgi:hypothetical protein
LNGRSITSHVSCPCCELVCGGASHRFALMPSIGQQESVSVRKFNRLKSAQGRVSRGSPVQTAIRNCTRDEGRSFEAGSQVLASNRCKLLSSKAMVVSVAVNVGRISRRVRLREASASEPPMNCRKRIRRCQNRGVTLPPGSARGNAEACPSGIRHVGGAKLNQALVRNVRTCAPMQRERSQAAQTARIREPMRSTGTEQPVVGTKVL